MKSLRKNLKDDLTKSDEYLTFTELIKILEEENRK